MKINIELQKIIPEYSKIKFKDEEAFTEWLHRKAKYIIKFKDEGQDCLEWFLDEGGEVVHSKYQAFVWSGKVVDLGKLKVGNCVVCVEVENNQGLMKHKRTEYDFQVEAIIKLRRNR